MISFLKEWIEGISISIILVSILEMIIPNGNIKKYLNVALGMYIMVCIISPFVKNINLFNMENSNLDDFINISTSSSIENENINTSLNKMYEEEFSENIKKVVEEYGYNVYSCNVKLDASDETGIGQINLEIGKKSIEIGKIKIDEETSNKNLLNEEVKKIKKELSKYYEIDESKINIEIS